MSEQPVMGTTKPEAKFAVNSIESHAEGGPLVGILVRAFDRDLRSEKLLGEQRRTRMDTVRFVIPLNNPRASKRKAPTY